MTRPSRSGGRGARSLPKDPDDDLWDEPDDNFWDNQPDSGHFDAFNDHTWRFEPAPPPWYRTKRALTAIIAASAAWPRSWCRACCWCSAAPANTVDDVTSSVTPTAPTSAPIPVATSAEPEPPLPPPETASPVIPRRGTPDVSASADQGAADRRDAVADQRRTAAAYRTARTSIALQVAPGQHVLRASLPSMRTKLSSKSRHSACAPATSSPSLCCAITATPPMWSHC